MKIGDKVNYDVFPDIVNGTGIIVEEDSKLCVEATDLTRDYCYNNGLSLILKLKECYAVRLFFNILNDKWFRVNWYPPVYDRLVLRKSIGFFCTNAGFDVDEIVKINALEEKEVLFLDCLSIERLEWFNMTYKIQFKVGNNWYFYKNDCGHGDDLYFNTKDKAKEFLLTLDSREFERRIIKVVWMGFFSRTFKVPNIVYCENNKQIIFSDNGKKFIASKKINEIWVLVRESTSYNVCYNSLHERNSRTTITR